MIYDNNLQNKVTYMKNIKNIKKNSGGDGLVRTQNVEFKKMLEQYINNLKQSHTKKLDNKIIVCYDI